MSAIERAAARFCGESSAWISGLQVTIPACSCDALRPAAARLVTGWRDRA